VFKSALNIFYRSQKFQLYVLFNNNPEYFRIYLYDTHSLVQLYLSKNWSKNFQFQLFLKKIIFRENSLEINAVNGIQRRKSFGNPYQD
jgi:hypothetical protein